MAVRVVKCLPSSLLENENEKKSPLGLFFHKYKIKLQIPA